MKIKLKELDYTLLNLLKEDKEAINTFLTEYSDMPFKQAIKDVADDYTPVYTYDVLEGAQYLSSYVKQAVDKGMYNFELAEFDLAQLIKCGYYLYYTELLNNNFNAMIKNYVIKPVNLFLNIYELNSNNKDNLPNPDLVMKDIVVECDKIGLDDDYERLDELTEQIIENIRNGVYA